MFSATPGVDHSTTPTTEPEALSGPGAHVSALDLFSIGIGPSSSHTVGPMRAAKRFAEELRDAGLLPKTSTVRMTLYGSLAATGVGHGTLGALIAGLAGADPETCDPVEVARVWSKDDGAHLRLLDAEPITIRPADFVYAPFTRMPKHPNAVRFEAIGDDPSADASHAVIHAALFYSVGGGFIERDGDEPVLQDDSIPYPYTSAAELLHMCSESGLDIAAIAFANETAKASEHEVNARLDAVWTAMRECVDAGIVTTGVLPGWLKVPKRAAEIARRLRAKEADGETDTIGEWLQCYAIAVNEQNASGARVVTAPTNGAAGIIPAVGYYAMTYRGMTEPEKWRRYLLTAGAVGALCKMNASISGAEAGCQGEVGSACTMAAAGLTAVLGGTPEQVENAAEVAMEHHLGLTCDPIGGFVQIPCIERNAIAAGTAVSATRLALMGDGTHVVSLDTVIETMRQTGRDMSQNYKETSRAGLAVNVVEC